jgi:SAM-dependent methyltransferase
VLLHSAALTAGRTSAARPSLLGGGRSRRVSRLAGAISRSADRCRAAPGWQDGGMARQPVLFDRAAGYYDQTRGLQPQAAARQTGLLAAEIGGSQAGPVLEIGVGTGRIAVPLAAAGFEILGVDLSGPMLARLAAKRSAVAAARASATRLPLRTGSAGAVIACHVLHLVGDWEAAVDEALRVLRPGCPLLASRGRDDGSTSELRYRICAEAGVTPLTAGIDDLDDLDGPMADRGATVRHLPPIPHPVTRSVAMFLDQVRAGTYSWTWSIPEPDRQRAVDAVAGWASSAMGDLQRVQIGGEPVRWRAYRLS